MKRFTLLLLASATLFACKKETHVPAEQSAESKNTTQSIPLIGDIYERISRAKANKYKEGETFADVGSHKLHYKAMGTGSAGKPTVVFEHGLDIGGLSAWYKVQPEVAKFARTISYDRAGIFMSERGNKPKTGDAMATDLYNLLKKTGHQSPYILVGHSMAGITLRSFVDKYANEVAGVVFVDARHPLHSKRAALDPVLKGQPYSPPSYWITRLACEFGYARFMMNDKDAVYPSTTPTESINVINRAFIPMSAPAVNEETRASESMSDHAAHLKYFSNIPLTVITKANKENREDPSFDAKDNAYIKLWMELQKEHLKLSTNSKHILATKSGHFVQLDEPEVVIDAVRELTSKY